MDNPPPLNGRTNMFQAGISSKFSQRHTVNFQDTSLNAASAAKVRAEKKMERQAEAIEKQQKKIEEQMKKIEDLTQKVQRQQMREAKRLRNRLSYAASRIQRVYRRYRNQKMILYTHAAIKIQTKWKTYAARTLYLQVQAEMEERRRHDASRIISTNLRVHVCRCRRKQTLVAYYQAASKIQGCFRMIYAKSILLRLRIQKKERDRIHHAATVIQSNVRCYMTRLVYLDVLYLICRIQAVIRGYLCRKHLRIEKLIDEQIVCKVQAMVRGMLLRKLLPKLRKKLLKRKQKALKQKMKEKQEAKEKKKAEAAAALKEHKRSIVPRFRPTADKVNEPKSPSTEEAEDVVKLQPKPKPKENPAESLEKNKRNFWLPSGANAASNRRLPGLPRKSLTGDVDEESEGNNNFIDEAVQHSQELYKKGSFLRKRHQKNRPARLNPVPMSPVVLVPTITTASGNNVSSARRDGDSGRQQEFKTEKTNQMFHVLEEKMKKEQELKQKLLQQKKAKQEIQDKRKRELENEFLENRWMEKEEKTMRLYVKFMQRRSIETKSKKKTIVQQREEMERIDMSREERLMRLYLKGLARQVQEAAQKKKAILLQQQLLLQLELEKSPHKYHEQQQQEEKLEFRVGSLEMPSDTLSEDTDHSKFHVNPMRKSKPPTKQKKNKPKKAKTSSNTTAEIEFLRRTYGGGNNSISRAQFKSTYTGGQEVDDLKRQLGIEVEDDKQDDDGQEEENEEENPQLDDGEKPFYQAAVDEKEDDFDYGNDFDEIVDESKLHKLIC